MLCEGGSVRLWVRRCPRGRRDAGQRTAPAGNRAPAGMRRVRRRLRGGRPGRGAARAVGGSARRRRRGTDPSDGRVLTNPASQATPQDRLCAARSATKQHPLMPRAVTYGGRTSEQSGRFCSPTRVHAQGHAPRWPTAPWPVHLLRVEGAVWPEQHRDVVLTSWTLLRTPASRRNHTARAGAGVTPRQGTPSARGGRLSADCDYGQMVRSVGPASSCCPAHAPSGGLHRFAEGAGRGVPTLPA
jgi:hypothetical protein